MRYNVIRSEKITIRAASQETGNGQSLHRIITAVSHRRSEEIVEFKDSKPLSKKDIRDLKSEMVALCADMM
jgi:ribosomal protein L11